MMPTATKTKTVTEDLLQLEADRDKRRQVLKAQRHEHYAAAESARNLATQRRRLIARQPGLVDHNDQPLADIDANPVAAIDAELEKIGDVGELYAKVQHTQRLEADSDARARDFIEAHGPELLRELDQADDGAAEAGWAAAIRSLRAAADPIHALEHRREQFGAERNSAGGGSVDQVLHFLTELEIAANG